MSPEIEAMCRREGLANPHEVVSQFRDTALAKGYEYLDWEAAFRNWMRSPITRRDYRPWSETDPDGFAGRAPTRQRDYGVAKPLIDLDEHTAAEVTQDIPSTEQDMSGEAALRLFDWSGPKDPPSGIAIAAPLRGPGRVEGGGQVSVHVRDLTDAPAPESGSPTPHKAAS